MLIVAMWACRESNHRNSNASSVIDRGVSRDTSDWLKETRGIRDIMEDGQGNLWFSSPDYIAKFDGNSIQYFSEDEGLGIVGNLHKDGRGAIWVENGFSIFRLDGDRFTEVPMEDSFVSNDRWFQRGLDPTDTSYVDPGLYHIREEGIGFIPYSVTRAANNKYLYLPTTKAHLGHDGTIWVATMEKVFGWQSNSFVSIGREEMGRQNDERQMGIRGIFVDSNGVLWMADNGAGIFTYDGRKTTNFTKAQGLDEGDVEGNTLHRAFSIAEDTTGNMWFGTVYSGIWKYNPKTEEFRNYAKDEGVMSENIWTIYKTKEGELLFAGESPAAIYRFNGDGFDRAL